MNKKKKSFSFNMNLLDSKIILLLLAIFSLAHSIPSEDFEAVYRENDCQEGECEVIELNFLSRRKRSVDSKMSVPIRIFGREKILHLEESSGVLVGPNTPVYHASSSSNIQVSYPLGKALARSQFYEDKANMAAFTFNVDADGNKKLKYGRIGSENVTIIPVKRVTNSTGGTGKKYYLAKSIGSFFNDLFSFVGDMIGIGDRVMHERTTPVPSQVYVEILLIIDHSLYSSYRNSIYDHVISVWNEADSLYRPLTNPRYKLSIAGIVIPKHSSVFNCLDSSGSISYKRVINDIIYWLKDASSSIPFDSYDSYMVMTSKQNHQSSVLGLTYVSSVCTGVNDHHPQGGIILYSKERGRSNTGMIAAHELGHALGANHDGDSVWSYLGIESTNYLMGPHGGSLGWSPRSRNELSNVMQANDFSCLDNYPKAGSSRRNHEPDFDSDNNGEEDIFPPIDNEIPSVDTDSNWPFDGDETNIPDDDPDIEIDSEYEDPFSNSNNSEDFDNDPSVEFIPSDVFDNTGENFPDNLPDPTSEDADQIPDYTPVDINPEPPVYIGSGNFNPPVIYNNPEPTYNPIWPNNGPYINNNPTIYSTGNNGGYYPPGNNNFRPDYNYNPPVYNYPPVISNQNPDYNVPVSKNEPKEKDFNSMRLASVSDEDILVIEASDIPVGKQLFIQFDNNFATTHVYHQNRDPLRLIYNSQGQDLRIRQSDNNVITIDPSIMNQSKSIYVAHDNGYIYVYQMAD